MENQTSSVALFESRTTVGYSEVMQSRDVKTSFHAVGETSAGAGAATVKIWVSNKPSPTDGTDVDWLELGEISLTLGTTQTGDGFVAEGSWRHVRAEVESISGTNAEVSVWMGA